MKTITRLLAVLVFTGWAGAASASLIGNTITASGEGVNDGSATIGAGVEFSGVINHLSYDFGTDYLRITDNLSGSHSWGDFQFAVFSGFAETITGLFIQSNVGFTGDILSGFTFDDHSISIHIGNSGKNGADAALVFGITSSNDGQIPAPATLALFGLGLVGLGWSCRKKA